jgi:hypothetical protein
MLSAALYLLGAGGSVVDCIVLSLFTINRHAYDLSHVLTMDGGT